ncbi:hypothetical protein G5I_00680 [Acromyrmex echinatior]|uniref:Uncharacterized protein n=1 Tax=Acromyrmex echinatior TaxID=103372 RepID=F4W5I3_ACREC|nr:hypothetical protein G5I_00680 [Acromyrmex echinatior]
MFCVIYRWFDANAVKLRNNYLLEACWHQLEATTRQQRTKEDEGTQWSEISLTLQPFHYTNGRLNLRCTAEIPGVYSKQSEVQLLSGMREPVPEREIISYEDIILVTEQNSQLDYCIPIDCIDAMHVTSVPIGPQFYDHIRTSRNRKVSSTDNLYPGVLNLALQWILLKIRYLVFRSSAPETPSIHVACIISRQPSPEAWIVVTQKEQCPAEENPLTFHLMAPPFFLIVRVSIPKGISTVDTPRPIIIGKLWENYYRQTLGNNLRKRKRHAYDDICDNTLPGHAPSASEIVTARLRPRKGSSRASHDK